MLISIGPKAYPKISYCPTYPKLSDVTKGRIVRMFDSATATIGYLLIDVRTGVGFEPVVCA